MGLIRLQSVQVIAKNSIKIRSFGFGTNLGIGVSVSTIGEADAVEGLLEEVIAFRGVAVMSSRVKLRKCAHADANIRNSITRTVYLRGILFDNDSPYELRAKYQLW